MRSMYLPGTFITTDWDDRDGNPTGLVESESDIDRPPKKKQKTEASD